MFHTVFIINTYTYVCNDNNNDNHKHNKTCDNDDDREDFEDNDIGNTRIFISDIAHFVTSWEVI